MKLRQLFEAEVGGKHLAFCFGRMNPPTIGHKQLLDTVARVGGDYKIFVSQTQDKKKNPLDYQTKIKFMKMMFAEHAKNIVDDAGLNTIGKIASHVYNLGYRDVTFVAGSDRLEDMKNLLTTYNGVEGKAHGYYKFDTLDFKSSGEREDGAEVGPGAVGVLDGPASFEGAVGHVARQLACVPEGDAAGDTAVGGGSIRRRGFILTPCLKKAADLVAKFDLFVP